VKRLNAIFYRSESGKEPVREWLKELGKPDSTVIGYDIKTVEFGWPIGMPICRPLGRGLYEVRSQLQNNRIARVIFCVFDDNMFLLHGFIKKTKKTPIQDIDLAYHRKKNLENSDDQ